MPDSLEDIIEKLSGKENGGAYCASCGKYHTDDNPHGMGLDAAGDEASEPVKIDQFPDTTQQTTEDNLVDNEYVLPEMGKTTNDSTVGDEYEQNPSPDTFSNNNNTVDNPPNETKWDSDSVVDGHEYENNSSPDVYSEDNTTVDGSNPQEEKWTSDGVVEEGINDITDQVFPPKVEDEEDFIQGPYHKEEQKFIPELDSNNIDPQDTDRDSSITILQNPASMGELENRGDMDNDFDVGASEDDSQAEQLEDSHLKQAINHLNQAYHAHLEESVDDTEEKEDDVADATKPHELDSFAGETGMPGEDPIPKHGNYHLDGYPAEIEEDEVYSQGYWPDPNAEVGSFYPQVKHISALDKLIASLSDSDQDVLNTFPGKESASESYFATERKGVVNFAGNTCTECGSYFSNSENRFYEAHIKAHEAEYKQELDNFLKDENEPEEKEEEKPMVSNEAAQVSEEARLANTLFKKPLNRLSATEHNFIYDYISEQNKTQTDIQEAVEIAREAIKKMDAVKEFGTETFMEKENARIDAGVDKMKVKSNEKAVPSKKKVNKQ